MLLPIMKTLKIQVFRDVYAVYTSMFYRPEELVIFTSWYSTTSQQTWIFINTVVRNSNLIYKKALYCTVQFWTRLVTRDEAQCLGITSFLKKKNIIYHNGVLCLIHCL